MRPTSDVRDATAAHGAELKIAFVTLQYPPHDVGGIGTYVKTVATGMAAAGHDVTVVCAARGQRRSTSVEDGVTVERFPVAGPEWLWRRVVPAGHLLRVRVHHALTTWLVMRRLGSRFDVVEVPEWKAQGLLLPARSLVVHAHLSLELEHAWNGTRSTGRNRLAYRLERHSARRAAIRTATSRQTTRFPDGSTWLADDEIDLVAPPIPVHEWRVDVPVEDTEPEVLFVGRLQRRKAPELLLDAMGMLVDEVPGLRVRFVGRSMGIDGRDYADLLRDGARDRRLPCEIIDPVHDPAQMAGLYASARVVAVPSRFETLSMVAFEALACGRPAVMSDEIGAVEWLGEGLPELVVPSGDAAALASALRPLLRDPSHAAEVGARGRRLVSEICSPDRIVSSRLANYRRLIPRGDP